MRIPLKNLKPLNGIPLVAYMIRAALNSKKLDRVIVSTDNQEIKNVSLELGAEVPFDRPAYISTDCPSELVTQHAVTFIEEEQEEQIDIAVSMQPTTPFCLGSDIDKCVKMLQEHPEWDSVFSGNIVSERPEWMFTFDEETSGGRLFIGEFLRGETGVVQALPKLVTPNGGVYATRRSALFDQGVAIAPKTGVHVMSFERSVDIDEPIDFEFAEFIIRRKEEKRGG